MPTTWHGHAACPQETPELALIGVWCVLCLAMSGKQDVAVPLIEGGIIDLAVASLHERSPVDWVSNRTPGGVLAGAVIVFGWSISTLPPLPGINMTSLLLEKGFIDVVISSLKAFELRGTSMVAETNVGTLVMGVLVMRALGESQICLICQICQICLICQICQICLI